MLKLLLWLWVICTVCFAVLSDNGPYLQKHIDEMERDLQSYAHLACSHSLQYTTGNPNIIYTDYDSKKNQIDHVLQYFVTLSNQSRVVHSQIATLEIDLYRRMPAALTGTNTGLGLGITNGTSKALRFAVEKRRIIPYFPPHHPRHNGSFCVRAGQLTELGTSSFYEHMRDEYKLSYVTILENAVVHQDGLVALRCGWLQHRQGCGSRVLRAGRIWRKNITSVIQSSIHRTEENAWQSMTTLNEVFGGSLPIYDEVFIMHALWDFNFYHTMAESLTRMVRFYHYLQRNKHIKIHVGAYVLRGFNTSDPLQQKRVDESNEMWRRVFELLEISPEAIIHGPLLARKLYLPNDIECSSSMKHALDLRLLSNLLVQKAEKVVKSGKCTVPTTLQTQRTFTSIRQSLPNIAHPHQTSVVDLPASGARVLVQARVCRYDWRCLNETVARQVARAAEDVFHLSEVVVTNTTLSRGLGCDIDLYRNADIVIGAHGAAMTNAMFMQPGTVLVEIVGTYDLRMPPICGFYGPYAAVFGVHHFIYYYDGVVKGAVLDVADLVAKTHEFYHAIRTKANYTVYDLVPGK